MKTTSDLKEKILELKKEKCGYSGALLSRRSYSKNC